MEETALFSEKLKLSLKVCAESETIEVSGGQIKGLSLELEPWGFRGAVEFWLSSETQDDALFPLFITQDLLQLDLTVEARLVPDGETAAPLSLSAVVTEKALLKEMTVKNLELSDDPVLHRFYRLCFADKGQVFWSQHYPLDLLVDGNLKDLLSKNSAGVPFTCELKDLETKRPINTLSGDTSPLGSSFYDFLFWLAESQNGTLFYDYEKGEYRLSQEKAPIKEAMELDSRDVREFVFHFPETPRFQDRLHNSYSEGAKTKEIDQDFKVEKVYRDRLYRHGVASDFEDHCTKASEKILSRSMEVQVVHGRFPWTTFYPGSGFSLKKGLWSTTIHAADETFRWGSIRISAQTDTSRPEASRGVGEGHFEMEVTARAELESETFVDLFPYRAPTFPFCVEGRVVSEQGEEEDKTYQVYEEEGSSAECYKVEIPILGEKQVVAPLEPAFATGHFYFPAFKGQRVLLELGLHSARIVRFLDFRPGGKLPMESQGNHLLLGKTDKDGTSISHVYVDGKPQLNIVRTSGKDKGSMQVQEGCIVLETLEEK
ncbi:MAG: hypothetical protein MI742_07330 [Desulfobacterales bacterium]|nr:hypothetical protein [Desulfobacterales bacterium]